MSLAGRFLERFARPARQMFRTGLLHAPQRRETCLFACRCRPPVQKVGRCLRRRFDLSGDAESPAREDFYRTIKKRFFFFHNAGDSHSDAIQSSAGDSVPSKGTVCASSR
jgi:hypothetical protein